jgi:hypothetical protein
MKDRGKNYRTSGISVGDIQGTGIVVGDGSSASVNLHQTSSQHEAATLLDEFIHLLQIHQDSVADSADILESAAAARAELVEPSPRWHIVKGLLKGVAAGVAGVSTLAEAINNIQTIIVHISS